MNKLESLSLIELLRLRNEALSSTMTGDVIRRAVDAELDDRGPDSKELLFQELDDKEKEINGLFDEIADLEEKNKKLMNGTY